MRDFAVFVSRKGDSNYAAQLLIALVAGVFWICVLGCFSGCSVGDKPQPDSEDDLTASTLTTPDAATSDVAGAAAPSESLPRLLDLGAGTCIPCKMMAPILDELKEQYADVIKVDFIDVWQQSEEAKRYGVDTIPTQIFFDAAGRERFRHVGFFSKEDILAKWRELGIEVQPKKAM